MEKLFSTLRQRYVDRNGGYTRVLRIPNRKGDSARMAVVEYVDNDLPPLPHVKKVPSRKADSQISSQIVETEV